MKKLDILAAVLIVVGGLNWGLVAVAKFDLVATLVGLDFGQTNAVSRIVYGSGGGRRRRIVVLLDRCGHVFVLKPALVRRALDRHGIDERHVQHVFERA
jgi:uncharacterized protein DUF378